MTRDKRSQLEPAIEWVPLGKLTIFSITEAELEALERGSPESVYLNLGIAVMSIAISFSISLATTTIESIKTFCFFVVVAAIGYLAALTFGLLWWQSQTSLRKVAQEIRNRRTPQGIQEDVQTGDASST